MKTGEEMPRQDSFTPHYGEQCVSTGTHQTNDLTIAQMQPLPIGRMHFQHIGIDQLENVCPTCLGPAIVMLENAASRQYERILSRGRLTRRQVLNGDKVCLPLWKCLLMHQCCAFVHGGRHRPL